MLGLPNAAFEVLETMNGGGLRGCASQKEPMVPLKTAYRL